MELTTSFQKIATGTQKSYGGSAGYLELWAKYNSQDVQNNKTNVTVELRLVVPYGYIGNYQATYWNISGDLSNNGNLGKGEYRSRTLGSATGNITHNTDGTKSVSFSGSFNPTAWNQTITVSGGADLPTLHTPPMIGTATMVETNSTLTALGLSDNVVVRYLSKKTITLNAYAYDSATLTYRLTHPNTNYALPSATTYQASNQFTTDYTTNDLTITNGKADISQDIKDSLNGTATDWVYVNIGGIVQRPNGIAYTKPSIERTSTSIKRKSGNGVNLTDNKANINFVGSIYKENNVIGNNNAVRTIGYKVWERDTTEPVNYTTLTPTISGGNVTVTNLEISNIDFTKAYNYKFILEDSYSDGTNYYSDVISGTIPLGQSLWSEYKDRVDFLKATIGGNPILMPYSLYTNSNGSNATIQLSDDASNYSYIEIYYFENHSSQGYSSIKVEDPDNKIINLGQIAPDESNNRVYISGAYYTISGTYITYDSSFSWAIQSSPYSVGNTNQMYITKVIGYK